MSSDVFQVRVCMSVVCVIGCVSCVSCLVYHVCMCVSVHSECVRMSLVCCVCMYPY